MLVYGWSDGEHLGTCSAARDDPTFSVPSLPCPASRRDPHGTRRALRPPPVAQPGGWVEGDFYDGALMYHFTARRPTVMDLDSYRLGVYRNDMGRTFGSTRFMAPEELELDAVIDDRTTVFVMGRTALVLLSDGSLDPASFGGSGASSTSFEQPSLRHRPTATPTTPPSTRPGSEPGGAPTNLARAAGDRMHAGSPHAGPRARSRSGPGARRAGRDECAGGPGAGHGRRVTRIGAAPWRRGRRRLPRSVG